MSRAPIIVLGAGGRMGRRIVALAEQGSEARVVGAVEIAGSHLMGQDVGELAGVPLIGVKVVADFAAAVSGAEQGAVAVDFTQPEAAVEHARQAAAMCTPIVIGTTGLTREQKNELELVSKRTPLLLSPNMSIGIHVLRGLVGEAVRKLGPGFDVEIVEVHHNRKKDAPSGTALALAEEAAAAAGVDPATAFVQSRQGLVGERRNGEIGVVAVRGGDNIGEHTVMLLGTGERLELIHRASSRDCLAAGAVRAAAWLHGKTPGLYSMSDVLGLR
ncbi:MAG TPA: 4-hydroxy-tetrahydrodipicolinate reductase [Candidatus Binatia bacterium]|jgi:4-hydroxy-tetrahydrodipicolinate reductase